MLAYRVRSVLEEGNGTHLSMSEPELELWILTWAAIGSFQKCSLLAWFSGRISKLTKNLCDRGWLRHRETL